LNSITVGNLKALLSLDTTNFDKGVTSSEANAKKLADRLSKDLAPSQARINSLIRDFAGNKDIARALEMATAVEKIGGSAKLTAAEQGRANKVVQEAIEKYKALGIEAPKRLMELANATKQAKKPTDDLGAGMTSLIGKAKSLAGIFGVSLGAGALVGFAKQTIDAADQIGDLATKMGVSTEAAQRFQIAAKQSGADIEDISKVVSHLNSGLGEGKSSGVSKALAQVGLQFENLKTMKPEQIFRASVDAIAGIADPLQQAAAASAIFGEKLGGTLLPMIRDGALKAADSVSVMSDDVIQDLKETKQAWEDFWRDLQVIAGPVLVWMFGELRQLLADLRTGMSLIAALVIPGFGVQGLELAKASASAPTVEQQRLNRLQSMLDNPALMSSHGPKFKPPPTDEEKEHARKIEKILDEFTDKGATERINELSEALAHVGVKDMTYVQLTKLRDELNKLAATGMKLGTVLERFRLTPIDFGNVSKFSRRLSNDMELLERQAFTYGDFNFGLTPVTFNRDTVDPLSHLTDFSAPDAPPQRVTFGSERDPIGFWLDSVFAKKPRPSLLQAGFRGAMGNLPQTILQAFAGGGNVGRSIGSLFGGQIGTSLLGGMTKDAQGNETDIFKNGFGKLLQDSFLGPKVGGMVASFIPGIGALLGPALGKLFSSIGNIGANTTKQGRQDFAKQMGFESLDNLYNKLRSLGAEGEKLANIGLNVIGKKDKAANEKWMKDVTAFFDRLEKVPGKVNELSQALGKFGGAVPKALDPLLDSILASPNLSPELRRQLEGMRKPSWEAAQEFANSVGVNLGSLGSGFNQSRLASSAFSLKRGLDLLSRFAGSDQNAILRDMADEFAALAADAQKNGVALPKAVQEFIRRIDEMNLLLDENGNRIDSSLLQFVDMEDEYEKQVVSLLEEIRDLLKPPTAPGDQPKPNPPGFTPKPPGTPPTPPALPGPLPVPYDFGAISMPDLGMQGFEAFGGTGAAVTTSAGVTNIYAIDAPSFEQFLSQRGGAEAVIRTMGPVIERWGKAQ
jgi:hypothetical protein